TGFDARELDALILGATLPGKADPDAVPDPPAEPVSKEGDLWLLGRHRLLCGDSTSPADVARLMDSEAADMVWTDPPYNVDYKGKAGKIKNDKMTPAEFDAFLDGLFAQAWAALADGGAIYVAHSEAGGGLAFRQAFARARFKLASCLIWRKHQMVLGRGDYHWQHEPILYGWKPTARHTWHADRKQTTLLEHFAGATVLESAPGQWQIATGDAVLLIQGQGVTVQELATSVLSVPKPAVSALHPTMKPVALVERMLANSSPRGGLVFDPCGGSGTTLMAAERMGRRCNTMELDPRFADVIKQRWEDYTGQTAILAAHPEALPAMHQEAAHAQ
ncbi:MAG: site-specific DNA-methyltransferase, partial [Proteobacteria bacterium]|nr:site-specific DNA-methyltransferase [Pseudomonadota bacterium]